MTRHAGLSHVGFLDGWRGLAIALVLYDHFFPSMRTTNVGRMGVDIFFCLSGLLMSNILYVQRVPLARFYKRRISRIIPVFLLFVSVTFAVHWLMTGEFSGTELLATATFLRTYVPEQPGIWESSLPIEHLWSLNVEEHCYVIMSKVPRSNPACGRSSAFDVYLRYLREVSGIDAVLRMAGHRSCGCTHHGFCGLLPC